MRAQLRAAQAEALHPHRGGKNAGRGGAEKEGPTSPEKPPKPATPSRDELGTWAHVEVGSNGSATIPFETLLACDLGYPYLDQRAGILRWWQQAVLDAWLDRWGLRALPVRDDDTLLVVVSAEEHRP